MPTAHSWFAWLGLTRLPMLSPSKEEQLSEIPEGLSQGWGALPLLQINAVWLQLWLLHLGSFLFWNSKLQNSVQARGKAWVIQQTCPMLPYCTWGQSWATNLLIIVCHPWDEIWPWGCRGNDARQTLAERCQLDIPQGTPEWNHRRAGTERRMPTPRQRPAWK